MFKCPLCGNSYKEIEDLYLHMEKTHSDIIPEEYTASRYLYQLKTGKKHGNCVICKKATGWNERTNKYHRFCDNPKCKEKYREIFKERMIGKHGKVTLLDDPEQQKKMLANRRISGTYDMNGKELGYTGSYELDYLKMLDNLLDWDEDDIMSPSPHTYWYEYEGTRHFYIPDFYIPSLNLEVEIKDGGDNPNLHHKIQAVDKEKERLKDQVMKTGNVNYVKIINKQYGAFFTFLNMAKSNFMKGIKEKPIILLESTVVEDISQQSEVVTESMGDVSSKCANCGSLIGHSEENRESRCYDCGHNYRTGKPLPTSSYSNLFNISEHNMDNTVLMPRVPTNFFTKNGYEDSKTNRVCFSSSIDGSLMALSQNISGKEFYVHSPACKQKIYKPNKSEVPDAHITDEVWVTTPTRIKCVGKVKVIGPTGSDINFKYGDGLTGVNGMWKWQWVEKFDNVLESAYDSPMLQPVFVLLTYTNSTMAKAIKLVTKQPYSHAGISLDSSLSQIFTYGRKTADDICRFTNENIFNGLLGENRDKIQYALYVTFFDNRQFQILQQHIENIKNDIKQHKYSYKGLLNFIRGKETHDDGMFCSQFVASVIKAGDPRRLKRDVSLYSPTDLREVHGMHFVTRGILGNYDKNKVENAVEKIKSNIAVRECNEVIESVMPHVDERILATQDDIVEFANMVNECTNISVLEDTKYYLDNEFCRPIIDNRINKIVSESTVLIPSNDSIYIIIETAKERCINDTIIAFNPNDKDTRIYTVTEHSTDTMMDFCTNKYSKSLNKIILEEVNTILPDDEDTVKVGFKIKASSDDIKSITGGFINARLSPSLHAGVILDTKDNKSLVSYMSSVLESIGVSNVEIERL